MKIIGVCSLGILIGCTAPLLPTTTEADCLARGWTIVYFADGTGGFCLRSNGDIAAVMRK